MKRSLIALAILAGASPAFAWTHGSGIIGNAVLNLGAGDLTAQSFVNVFNGAQVTFSGGATPSAVDTNGIPTANFSGTIGGQLGASDGTLSTAGPWILGWKAGSSCFKINFLNSATVSSNPSGITIANGSGSGNLSATGLCNGAAGSITLTWNNTGTLSYQLDGTYTQWSSNVAGSGGFYLIRSSDQTAYNNGTFWTQEMYAFIKALHPETLRPMGWNVQNGDGLITGTNVANFSTRKTTSSFSFVADDYPPSTRCGGATSFCTISVASGVLTASAATGTNLSGWTDGEQITGNVASTVSPLVVTNVTSNAGKCQFTVSSTTGLTASHPVFVSGVGGATECNTQTTIQSVDSLTQFTIPITKTNAYTSGGTVGYQTLAVTGKSASAVLIANQLGVPIGGFFGDSLSSGNSTFTYNAVLNRVIYTPNGVNNAIPIEAQVQLANLTNANLWYNFSVPSTDSFITSAANLAYSSGLSGKFITEYGNEGWNYSLGSDAHLLTQMGISLGLTTNSYAPFQSLRIRLINGNLLPASSWGGSSRLERLYCFQGGWGGYSPGVDGMAGAFLTSPGTSAYQSYVGPYIASPGTTGYGFNTTVGSGGNGRPIDSTDSVCYAPYVGGGTALSGQSSDIGLTPTTYDATLLNTIVADWNGGQQSAAETLIDQSVRGDYLNRVQTVTASGTTFTTPLAHNLSQYDIVRFTAAGGTAYSGLNLNSTYQILSVTSTTFTAGQVLNGITQSAVNAGTVGSGTTSVGYLSPGSAGNNNGASGTIFGLMSGWFTKYQNMVATNFSPAPTGGVPNVRWYEGAIEPSAPSTAQCTAISINSTDCATLATALIGWKNSSLAASTIQNYYQTFKGTAAGTITSGLMPNSKAPSQLVLQGGGLYGLNSNTSYVSPAPYQTYYGFQSFNVGP